MKEEGTGFSDFFPGTGGVNRDLPHIPEALYLMSRLPRKREKIICLKCDTSPSINKLFLDWTMCFQRPPPNNRMDPPTKRPKYKLASQHKDRFSGGAYVNQEKIVDRFISQHIEMERERLFSCDECGKSFHQMNQLKQHLIIHMPEEQRPFSCYLCAKRFNRLHHLKLHLMVHLGQSPHTCKICGRTCNQLSDLKKHQMIHTGERPHSCPICGKGFIQIGGMRRHIQKHEEEASMSLSCKVCGKTFAKVGYLKKHMVCHNADVKPFVCDICGKSFVQEAGFKQHMVTHNGEEPHACEHCGKSFKRIGNLEKHVITHSGSLPYTCLVCGKQFLQLGSFKRHSAKHERLDDGSFDSTDIPNTDDEVTTNETDNFVSEVAEDSYCVVRDQIVMKAKEPIVNNADESGQHMLIKLGSDNSSADSSKREETFMILINDSNIDDITNDIMGAIQ